MNTQAVPSTMRLSDHKPDSNAEVWYPLPRSVQVRLLRRARALVESSQLANRLEPEDLVGAAVVQGWKGRDQFAGLTRQGHTSWLLAILENCFHNELRVNDRVLRQLSAWMTPLSPERTMTSQITFRDNRDRLHRCIQSLEPSTREVIILRHIKGLKLREVAERIGEPMTVVAGRQRRGLARLVRLMRQE